MTKRMKVASIQMDVKFGQKRENYEKALVLLEEAKKRGSDVALLPELWDLGFFPENNLSQMADLEGVETKAFLSSCARKLDMNIVGGSVVNKRGKELYNSCFVFDRSGHLQAEYDKTHLFSPLNEDKFFTPGDHLSTFMLDGVKCGVILCYDLRFPELSRRLSLDGVEMLFVSASWPLERKEHLLTLSIARAIENEIYLVLSSSAGKREDIDFCGCSSIYSPTGELLATQDNQEEGIVEACFDEKEVYLARTNLPVFKDRKPNLYK